MPIDPRKLVAEDPKILLAVPGQPDQAFVDRTNGVVVQVWKHATPGCNGTPWQGTLRVAVKHTRGKTPEKAMDRKYSKPITWDDLQAIKDHYWPERIAIEIFPPRSQIVDVADMRWMWVLPKGAMLPFNLRGDSIEKLSS